jgi:hypothetical protein
MNERIKQTARQSGATNENGGKATTVFCFTETELEGFAELIVSECANLVDAAISDGGVDGAVILEHFGVDK